jgi:hypothetical protein
VKLRNILGVRSRTHTLYTPAELTINKQVNEAVQIVFEMENKTV